MSTVAWIFTIIGMIGAAGLVAFILSLFVMLAIVAYKDLVR